MADSDQKPAERVGPGGLPAPSGTAKPSLPSQGVQRSGSTPAAGPSTPSSLPAPSPASGQVVPKSEEAGMIAPQPLAAGPSSAVKRTRQLEAAGYTGSEIAEIQSRAAAFDLALALDQDATLYPAPPTAFTSYEDVVERLLPYHIWQVPEEELLAPTEQRQAEDLKQSAELVQQLVNIRERFTKVRRREGENASDVTSLIRLIQESTSQVREELQVVHGELRQARAQQEALETEARRVREAALAKQRELQRVEEERRRREAYLASMRANAIAAQQSPPSMAGSPAAPIQYRPPTPATPSAQRPPAPATPSAQRPPLVAAAQAAHASSPAVRPPPQMGVGGGRPPVLPQPAIPPAAPATPYAPSTPAAPTPAVSTPAASTPAVSSTPSPSSQSTPSTPLSPTRGRPRGRPRGRGRGGLRETVLTHTAAGASTPGVPTTDPSLPASPAPSSAPATTSGASTPGISTSTPPPPKSGEPVQITVPMHQLPQYVAARILVLPQDSSQPKAPATVIRTSEDRKNATLSIDLGACNQVQLQTLARLLNVQARPANGTATTGTPGAAGAAAPTGTAAPPAASTPGDGPAPGAT